MKGEERAAARAGGVSVTEYRDRINQGQRWCFRCQDWHGSYRFGSDRRRQDGLATSCRDSLNALAQRRRSR